MNPDNCHDQGAEKKHSEQFAELIDLTDEELEKAGVYGGHRNWDGHGGHDDNDHYYHHCHHWHHHWHCHRHDWD